jgi:hypothetical protein
VYTMADFCVLVEDKKMKEGYTEIKWRRKCMGPRSFVLKLVCLKFHFLFQSPVLP